MNPDVIFPNLAIKISNLPRVALSINGFNLYLYGMIIGLGILAGLAYGIHEAKRTKQNPELYSDFLIYAIIFAVIGARLYFVIFSWDDGYKDNLFKIFAIREGGLAIYGGVIGCVLTGFFYTRKRKIGFRIFADTAIPGLVLGQAIGRWGNFFNREAFGSYTESFFAMQYLKEKVSYIPESVMKGIVTINGAEYIQVHPTFLYESVWCIGVFIFLNVYKYHKKADGEVFAMYFVGYGLGRLWIEGLRTDQLLFWGTHIAVSQVLSFLLIIAGFGFVAYCRKLIDTQID